MSSGGFEVDLDAMREAARGIDRTLRDMEACEVDAICGPEVEYGHEDLALGRVDTPTRHLVWLSDVPPGARHPGHAQTTHTGKLASRGARIGVS